MLSLVFASLTLSLSVFQSPLASRPDFSGSWTMERSRSGKTSTRTYPVEASPHSASETISAGHTHASWDGTKLVTEAVTDINGQTVSYRQMRFLNASGTEMTVETITIVQHGYGIKDGKNYSTTKDVYVRAK